MAEGLLYPSGLPTQSPFILPAPDMIERLTASSFVSTLVILGPTELNPFLIAPSRKKCTARTARRISTSKPIKRRTISFFINLTGKDAFHRVHKLFRVIRFGEEKVRLHRRMAIDVLADGAADEDDFLL